MFSDVKKCGCLGNHFWNFQTAFSLNVYRIKKYGSLGNHYFLLPETWQPRQPSFSP